MEEYLFGSARRYLTIPALHLSDQCHVSIASDLNELFVVVVQTYAILASFVWYIPIHDVLLNAGTELKVAMH